MKIVSTSVLSAIALLSSTMMASEVKIMTVPVENIALHNNQILVYQNGDWTCIGGISPDGKGLYLSEALPPMFGCSRFEIEAKYKDFEIIIKIEPDNGNNNTNEQQTEQRDPPDSRDHAERDHAEQNR